MNKHLELHHIAGRKHDYRTITVDKKCHYELSESQKTWDGRWLQQRQERKDNQNNRVTNTRNMF